MAEMEVKDSGGKKGPGVGKSKKLSTRVDLTPMVDLGFLLITFFMFTTTLSQPSAMDLFIPKDTEKKEEQNKIKESGAMTLLLGENNTIYYYEGFLNKVDNLLISDYKDIRKILLDKKGKTDSADFVVVIKPTNDATYKNAVDVLDEMAINEIKRYALVDVQPTELEMIQAKLKKNKENSIK